MRPCVYKLLWNKYKMGVAYATHVYVGNYLLANGGYTNFFMQEILDVTSAFGPNKQIPGLIVLLDHPVLEVHYGQVVEHWGLVNKLPPKEPVHVRFPDRIVAWDVEFVTMRTLVAFFYLDTEKMIQVPEHVSIRSFLEHVKLPDFALRDWAAENNFKELMI